MAAVLALGEEAAVSHRSAAALWRMLPPHEGPIEITVPGDGGREKRKGLKLHTLRHLHCRFSTCRNGIAVTRPKRTLRDLQRSSPQPVFRRAVRRALDRRLITSDDPRREDELTRSELERAFLALCRATAFPSRKRTPVSAPTKSTSSGAITG